LIKLKSLNKKLLKLEASLQKDAKKLAKLKRKVETALGAECVARVSTELQRNASLTLHPLGYCERISFCSPFFASVIFASGLIRYDS
jgi:hypothetical protein